MFAFPMKWTGTLTVCGVLLTATLLDAGNWPRFRGPNGTGVVENEKVPVEWTNDNILWKVPLPGEGHSSPVVWDNRLFVQTASMDVSKRLLLCLDASNGKTLWSVAMAGSKVHKHPKNSFASSTPATDGQRVYASFWDGDDVILSAYDFDGKRVWQKNIGSFTSQHGSGASPILYKDKVIYFNDQDGKSTLFALNARTGRIVWQSKRPPFRACYGAPFLWEREKGKQELVVISTLEFTGYNPDTGEPNWRWPWKHFTRRPLRVTGSPVFANNLIYGSSGDGGGDRYMVAVGIDGKGEATAELKWENKKDFPYVPTMLAYKGKLYFTNDHGVAGCFDATTGKQVWSKRISEVAFTSSPVIVDGKVYAANEEGDVYVFAADTTFRPLARNELGERIRASPAVSGNRIFFRGRTHLFCIGKK